MKLRISGDAIRLRLGPRDVADLLRTGTLVEATRVAPGQTLRFALHLAAAVAVPTAEYDCADGLHVLLPAAAARAWANSPDQVSIRGDQPAGDGATLHLLVEKDFPCRDGTDPPDADVFPHPAAAATC